MLPHLGDATRTLGEPSGEREALAREFALPDGGHLLAWPRPNPGEFKEATDEGDCGDCGRLRWCL